MEKRMVVLLLAVIFVIVNCANAQTSAFAKDRVNIVGFGGYEAQRLNTGVNDQYLGLYADLLILKTPNWMLGPYLMFDVSRAEDNMSWFSGHGYEVGLGATLGYFSWNYSPSHKLYTSFNAGIKFNHSSGESVHRGNYRETQRDLLLALGFDFDLIKKQNIAFLPRSQFLASFQTPLSTSKEAYWNDQAVGTTAWSKTDLKLVGKQSLTTFRAAWQTCMALKVLGLYQYTQRQSLWGLGGEVSMFKLDKDDFVLVNCLYRWHPDRQKNDLAFQVVVNFTAF